MILNSVVELDNKYNYNNCSFCVGVGLDVVNTGRHIKTVRSARIDSFGYGCGAGTDTNLHVIYDILTNYTNSVSKVIGRLHSINS